MKSTDISRKRRLRNILFIAGCVRCRIIQIWIVSGAGGDIYRKAQYFSGFCCRYKLLNLNISEHKP